ncbi:toxic anion resistance protein [Bacillus sp. SCS-153A]|uniref:toxic anion resistance protein n=1 Tax=Rossellomorea sedimentorum TaxID=3115294 RepID=UPI003906460F
MNSNNSSEYKNDDLEALLADPFAGSTPDSSESVRAPVALADRLTPEHRQKAEEIAKQIDMHNSQAILEYGTAAQAQMSNFSHSMLDHVQKKDVGPIGDVLNDLMKRLKEMNPEELSDEKKGFVKRFFGKLSSSIQEVLSKYQKIGSQVDRISVKLEQSKNVLIDDNRFLDELYEKNKTYFQSLNIYIAAAELKHEELSTVTIPNLRRKAESTQDDMAYQEVNDALQFLDRLEKRIHDLKISRQMTIQTAPQIRLIQNTNGALAEKIQSSILTSIPLWKNQIAIALTLFHQKKAVQAQKQVSDTTNELLLKNSQMLKTNSIEAAKENERAIIDMETLKKTQENLISTIEETLRIQQEGRSKRQQAEKELLSMENDLKNKLLHLK